MPDGEGKTETTILRISLVATFNSEGRLWNRSSLECDVIHDMSSGLTQVLDHMEVILMQQQCEAHWKAIVLDPYLENRHVSNFILSFSLADLEIIKLSAHYPAVISPFLGGVFENAFVVQLVLIPLNFLFGPDTKHRESGHE